MLASDSGGREHGDFGGRPVTRTSGRLGRGPALRRVCLIAVVAPLSVIATSGLVRPDASAPGRSVLAFPAASAADPVVPDVPGLSRAVEAPASVSEDPRRDSAGLGVLVNARGAASVEAVPSRALTAYQRAETVMRQADPSCHVTWQLIAAIGQVESDHGRFGGALMTADGVVHPEILGPRLTGRGATSRIGDTDAGLLDGDQRYDRAVGPMQFIPSTWTVVGVDADGDGRRDPQDIDDASLATAVYLCSGSDDLATRAGQRASVFRYNHSTAYVDLVIGIMAGYLQADPSMFQLIGGTGIDPGKYPYPTGGGRGPVPGHPEPTFEVVDPTSGPTSGPTSDPTSGPTGKPSGQPTTKPTATVTETATPVPSAKPTPSPTATPTAAAPTTAPATPSAAPSDVPSSPAPAPTEPTESGTPTEPSASGTPTATATADPTDGPTGGPTGGPTDPGDGGTEIPQAVHDAYAACVTAGVDPADLVGMTACLVEATGLAADDPILVAVLANPPVTPPAPTETQPQARRRRRR